MTAAMEQARRHWVEKFPGGLVAVLSAERDEARAALEKANDRLLEQTIVIGTLQIGLRDARAIARRLAAELDQWMDKDCATFAVLEAFHALPWAKDDA
jgi:hypothetical protein